MKKLRTQLTQLSRFILDISAKSIIELTWLPTYGIIYAYSLYISIHGTGDNMEKELLNRNLYRQIKSMDKNELSRTLNNIYEMGREDAMKGIEAIDIDMDKLRSQIGAIKGIGETRLNLIMEIISEHLNVNKEE